jgi:hypothetical protein
MANEGTGAITTARHIASKGGVDIPICQDNFSGFQRRDNVALDPVDLGPLEYRALDTHRPTAGALVVVAPGDLDRSDIAHEPGEGLEVIDEQPDFIGRCVDVLHYPNQWHCPRRSPRVQEWADCSSPLSSRPRCREP